MLSWQYFNTASTTYQMFLKTNGRLSDGLQVLEQNPAQPFGFTSRKDGRLEQRLYWSCFKSEAEFRVELPLPQSEIAEYEFPKLFPSPPSPPSPNHNIALSVTELVESPPISSPQSSRSIAITDTGSIRAHAKRLSKEQESWYYYLTEVALRRIGNRIINTFFASGRESWLHIEPYLDLAVEFEAQVNSWYANLPPAMQKYETNSTIRQPRREPSIVGGQVDFVSRELSWATENRLSEMRSWLYQPFLYYLVHARPARPNTGPEPVSSHQTSSETQLQSSEATNVLWGLIMRGIDCNLAILDTRSLPHRHHGLWYDLRSITCASFILLAVVKAGYADLISGGTAVLTGSTDGWSGSPHLRRVRTGSSSSSRQYAGLPIGGKYGQVLAQLRLWSLESPDMIRHADVLESLVRDVMT